MAVTNHEAHLPLTEAVFFILLSLALEPKHGYAIMKEVEHLSAARVVFSTGTLYGALKRLLDQGWIKREDGVVVDDTNRQQKVYALTDMGRSILAAETRRMQSLVDISVERRVVGE